MMSTLTNELIDAKIAELNSIEAQAAILKKRAETIRDELKAELDARNEECVNTGLHKVFYTCYDKSSVDTAKLKEAGLYDHYLKKQTVIQFKITNVKQV